MRAPLALAVAQPLAGAAAHADAILRSGARLVVFPELSFTGYHYDATPISPDDPSLAPIVDACRSVSAIALVGAPVDGPNIAMLRVDGDGASVAYRKWFVAPSEVAHFKSDPGPTVIDIDGWRIGLGICFDTCNAEHWEATAALGIDVYAAGVLDSPEELSTQGERIAQFRPEGVAVAFASFAGATGAGYDRSAGYSRILDRDGTLLAQAGDTIGEVVTATLRD
jgi:predicted amidohydrolase